MSKKMLINATHLEENRVAIVEDGVLAELDIEIAGSELHKGNIYKATVVRVEPGLQAAFVDYGANRLGFLQIGELHPSLFPKKDQDSDDSKSHNRARINEILKRGQELIVQIVREERGTKGAALTTNLSLPGRYMVLMPESDTQGISRKVEDDATRKKLKEAMASLKIPDNIGYIVRTAGIGQKVTELRRDYKYLSGIHKKIEQLNKKEKAPALLYQESNIVIRSIREYFTLDMDEILIDDPDVFNEAQEFFKAIMPAQVKILKLHQEKRPIFSRYQVEEQIETIIRNKVDLPSGGSIVIDITEALVAIDVNSGRMTSEKGIEATAFKSNMEAAAEIGRQLRLRDLGGLVVIDFIDMRDRKNNREVEKTLKNSLKNDKARLSVGKISQFGLLEMSRQRMRPTLAEGSYLSCPNCSGSGRVKSAEAQAVNVLRQLHTSCSKGKVGKAEVRLPAEVANYLLNTRREELVEMEKRLKLSISIVGHADFVDGQVELEITKQEKGSEETPEPAAPTATPQQEQAQATPDPISNGETKDPEKKRRRPPRRRSGAKKPIEGDKPEAVASGENKEVVQEKPTETSSNGASSTQPNQTAFTQEQQQAVIPTPGPIDESTGATPESSGENEVKEPSKRRRRPPRRRSSAKKPADEQKSESVAPEEKKEIAPEKQTAGNQPKPARRFFSEPIMEPLSPTKKDGDSE